MTAPTELAYTLGSVSDEHVVRLTDITGAPHVEPRWSNSTVTDAYAVTITWQRAAYSGTYERYGRWHESDTYQLTRVLVDGYRVKRDGTRGGQSQQVSWTGLSDRNPSYPLPDWLAQLAERYAPNNDRIARDLP